MPPETSTPAILRDLQRHNPDAARLARLAALAARIEPALLRALRLELLSGADVSAEGDLWFSELVEIPGPSSIVLHAHALPALQRWLPEERGLLEQAAAIV